MNDIKRVSNFTEQGFSLIEVLIAMFIFSFGILGVTAMQMSSTEGNTTAGSSTELTAVALDQMEKLLNTPYTHGDLAPGTHTISSPIDRFEDIEWTVVENDIVSNTKTLTLTVTENHGRRELQLVLQHIIPEI
ncbi:MAG: prepilin-type N-terminal cleavage/methylation domain-containing protein [Desulfamplus sp.]|nr:prepilin-type N-terminal cleavage/methylation domain-containing protein [Desulfamplus sp.]